MEIKINEVILIKQTLEEALKHNQYLNRVSLKDLELIGVVWGA